MTATSLLAPTPTRIQPQPGPQYAFLRSPADIVIYGGAAGGGKTWALLFEPIRHLARPKFSAVIFRREVPQITNPGGLWDESLSLYPYQRGTPRAGLHDWTFPSGAEVKFSGLEHEKDLDAKWTGAQIPFIGFDQLETFTARMFWYMQSRNRSLCGIKPYLRATCNPVPLDDEVGGWLTRLIAWWIDPDTGYALPDRSGVLRWFVRIGEELYWADTPDALRAQFKDLPVEDVLPQSMTFIPAQLDDNQILMRADPTYRAKLLALPSFERERLLRGNWKVRPTAGKIFNRAWFPILEALPAEPTYRVRYWDKAATEDGGCNSAGVLMHYYETTRRFVVAHCVAGQWSARQRELVIQQTALTDGPDVRIWLEQEPGSGGKESAENTIANLPGFIVRADAVRGDKILRAYPMSAQAEAGNVSVLAGPWTDAWLDEAHAFCAESRRKDRVDASTGAFNKLAEHLKTAFGISGGGAVTPSEPVPVGENGHTQHVDEALLALLRTGQGMGFR